MIFHSVFFFYFFIQESSWIHHGTERDRGKLIPLRRIQQEEHEASTLRLPRSSRETVSVQLIQLNLNLKTDHDLRSQQVVFRPNKQSNHMRGGSNADSRGHESQRICPRKGRQALDLQLLPDIEPSP